MNDQEQDYEGEEQPTFDDQPSKQTLEKILQLPCSSCGSELTYSAEKKQLYCQHCGHTQDFDKANDMIRERGLAEAEQMMQHYSPASIQKKVIECSSCRAQLMIEENAVAIRCNFCGSEKVNEAAFKKNLIQPQGIVPFKIPKQESVDKFKAWIKEGWFRPNKLKTLANLGDLHGIYLPFWTFDADSYNQWSGEAGTYYYVTVKGSDGKNKQERRIRWRWRSGSFNRHFDDVLILASKGSSRSIVEGIYPFVLSESINYNPQLMVGWEAEIYSVEIDEGYKMGEEVMRDAIRAQASRALGGDTQRGLNVRSDIYDQTFKHLILPIWLCTYTYNGKAYQFAINGQTGKINGQKPFSWVKITFFILFLIAIGVGIYFATQMNKN